MCLLYYITRLMSIKMLKIFFIKLILRVVISSLVIQ
uniref:Uncharacterized protein n=1 Tax=Siphoviridae sp. ctHip2 TaxID=2827830 RepID=A0A8S5RWM2_9CAUD|nr:MAG TPA: hypothetical protein [Siphoviridae sp. ctHip2]